MLTARNVETGKTQGLAFALRSWSREAAPLASILDIPERQAREVLALRLAILRAQQRECCPDCGAPLISGECSNRA